MSLRIWNLLRFEFDISVLCSEYGVEQYDNKMALSCHHSINDNNDIQCAAYSLADEEGCKMQMH